MALTIYELYETHKGNLEALNKDLQEGINNNSFKSTAVEQFNHEQNQGRNAENPYGPLMRKWLDARQGENKISKDSPLESLRDHQFFAELVQQIRAFQAAYPKDFETIEGYMEFVATLLAQIPSDQDLYQCDLDKLGKSAAGQSAEHSKWSSEGYAQGLRVIFPLVLLRFFIVFLTEFLQKISQVRFSSNTHLVEEDLNNITELFKLAVLSQRPAQNSEEHTKKHTKKHTEAVRNFLLLAVKNEPLLLLLKEHTEEDRIKTAALAEKIIEGHKKNARIDGCKEAWNDSLKSASGRASTLFFSYTAGSQENKTTNTDGNQEEANQTKPNQRKPTS